MRSTRGKETSDKRKIIIITLNILPTLQIPKPAFRHNLEEIPHNFYDPS
jgi:hypothetical protein